jgi:hypothetical protein
MKYITTSGNGHFKYLNHNNRLYAISINRDTSPVFNIIKNKYFKPKSTRLSVVEESLFQDDMEANRIQSKEYVDLFFSSNIWRKFIINPGVIKSNDPESHRRMIDLVFCVDYNQKTTISKINFDESGVLSALNIHEIKNSLMSFFSEDSFGKLIYSIPLLNVKDYVASPDWIAFRMINNTIYIHGKNDPRILESYLELFNNY